MTGRFVIARGIASPRSAWLVVAGLLAACRLCAAQPEGAAGLVMPTENEALFRGGGAAFYQYIERDYKGERTFPWQGGQYGFVRNPRETGGGLVYSRFHEGIDICPIRRDSSGEPTDEVRSVADGTVVYVTGPRSRSGYGTYVVVEHWWSGLPYYTLSAHLARASVSRGQRVVRGQTLGAMGHTGSGLSRERAHLHFEINLLLNSDFEAWHTQWRPKEPNDHGIYNGLNLAGIDVARFLIADRKKPGIGVPEFLRTEQPFYTVRAPNRGRLDVVSRYPWLLSGPASGASWEITFDASGLPLSVRASSAPAKSPEVVWVKPSRLPYSLQTRGHLTLDHGSVCLSQGGVRYLDLLTR